jgi:opacity protein-like surface antigen
MKKLLFTALLAVTIGSSAFAAENENVNIAIRRSFNVEFKEASNVSWTTTGRFAKATFILDDQKMEAFYNTDGEMIGTSKSTSVDALPVAAKRSFTKKFGDYTVKKRSVLKEMKKQLTLFLQKMTANQLSLKLTIQTNYQQLKKQKNK